MDRIPRAQGPGLPEESKMAYASGNPRSKAELKRMLASGQEVRVFYPGLGYPGADDGIVYLEGPHYPEAHRWYAKCKVEGGVVTKVIQ